MASINLCATMYPNSHLKDSFEKDSEIETSEKLSEGYFLSEWLQGSHKIYGMRIILARCNTQQHCAFAAIRNEENLPFPCCRSSSLGGTNRETQNVV